MRIRKHFAVGCAFILLLSLMSTQVHAQTEALDTAAVNALNRMAAYLNTLTAFQVSAEGSVEEVLLDGQKVQMSASADLVAERPNRLRVDVTGDRRKRLFLFDGTTFTLWAPTNKYYAQVPAPTTIEQLADEVELRYGLELPLVDLFRWGSPESVLRDLTSAKDIGPSTIDGVTTQHYAFRQQGLDWQIWIQKGEYPLPRKLVLTTLTDEAHPQYSVVYSWNLAPSYNEASFTFVVPTDAKQIPIADMAVVRTAGNP
jgi:hypothetical protein